MHRPLGSPTQKQHIPDETCGNYHVPDDERYPARVDYDKDATEQSQERDNRICRCPKVGLVPVDSRMPHDDAGESDERIQDKTQKSRHFSQKLKMPPEKHQQKHS